jgi:UDP-N-acetylmuramoylalanine--D-glutamate ligase
MRHDTSVILRNLKKSLKLDRETSRILVVGLGITGESVVRYLINLGFAFTVADSRENAPIPDFSGQTAENVEIHRGPFTLGLFQAATHLIVSPGISLKEPAITHAVTGGARVLGDIDLFACSANAPIVAITGANGKTTVTTLMGEMARAAGKKVGVGGNIGLPALDLLNEPVDLFVLELSSFQLERTTCLNAAAAVVLNISADHMDRHENLTDYAQQKRRIFHGKGVMVLNADDPMVLAMREKARRTFTFSVTKPADFCLAKINDVENVLYGGHPLLPLKNLKIAGRHNVANALAALALGVALGLDLKKMCSALKKFQGLPHRMEKVAEIKGVTWVNDSKATNVGACIAALDGYNDHIILIAGGDAKGADMRDLTPSVKAKAKSVVLMGKDADLIEAALNGCVPVFKAHNMQEAVRIAADLAHPGDSVLLSPACASLDQYKNYQERGELFAKAVREIRA